MPNADTAFLLIQLAALRAELVDLAFALDQRGQPAAVDVAMMAVARLDELGAEGRGIDAGRPAHRGRAALSGVTDLVR